jgi:hypothetical protein
VRAAVALLIVISTSSVAGASDTVRLYKPGHYAVSRIYQLELLSGALRRSEPEFGPYTEAPYTESISVARVLVEAVHGELINIVISDVGQDDLNREMLPVPIALDKGRHGYRVAFIRQEQQEQLRSVRTIESARALVIGQGAGWGDIRIYEHNGFTVLTGPTHDALRLMLSRGRFDIFPRSVLEAQKEFASFHDEHPDLKIDEHLLIRYPFSQHFYVAKTAPRIAERLRIGLTKLVDDGTFDAAFDKHFGAAMSALNLDRRVVIDLDNPFLPDWAARPR